MKQGRNHLFREFLPTANVYTGVHACHAFMKTRRGAVYAVGWNNAGQLGLGDNIDRSEPTIIPLFETQGASLKQAACGYSHSLFLTAANEVYSSGLNNLGQLGLGDTVSRSSPEKVCFPGAKDVIVDIGVGWDASYCLTSDGRLFSFGINKIGQLGDGTYADRNLPVLCKFPNDVKIIRIATGTWHVAAMSENGSIYTFGNNIQGQLGRDGEPSIPQVVGGLPQSAGAMQVLCGGDHTMVLFSPNEIYSFGNNENGQLGIGNTTEQFKPVRVEWFREHRIAAMSVGSDHTMAILETGEIVGSGLNAYHQICNYNDCDVLSPTLLSQIHVGGSPIVNIVCGCVHTFFITEDGCCHGVGYGHTFGRNTNFSEPVELLKDVAMGHDCWLASDLMDYIVEEQEIVNRGAGTTDMCLNIRGMDEIHTIFVNKALASMVCNLDLLSAELAVKSFANAAEVGRRILCNLYGGFEMPLPEIKLESCFHGPIHDCMLNLWRLRESEGDIVIVSGNASRKAHKFVLVARTPYFRSMFRGGWEEATKGVVNLDIPLDDAFDAYLMFLYTGDFDRSSLETEKIFSYIEYFGIGEGEMANIEETMRHFSNT